MKTKLLIASVLVIVIVTGCNRKKFVKELTGTWSLNRYLYSGYDETATYKDTLMSKYKLEIESDQEYIESWQSLSYQADTFYRADTLSYDSTTSTYLIRHDTIPYLDSVITPHSDNGRWELTNSESDLELLDDSAGSARIYTILKLNSSTLDLQNGNYEMDLGK